VFVHDFAIVDRAYERVVAGLAEESFPGDLFDAALAGARREGDRLRARIGPAGWPAALSRTVELQWGPMRRHGDSVLIPLSWEATSGPSLFPRVEADVELSPLGASQTRMTLWARYEPPAGALGRHLDRVLLNRVAESTLRAFLAGLAASAGCLVTGSSVPGCAGAG
jgi:hypothetical protein